MTSFIKQQQTTPHQNLLTCSTHLSPHNCVERLRSLVGTESFGLLRTRLNVGHADTDIAHFTLSRSHYAIGTGYRINQRGVGAWNYVKVEVRGTLTSLDLFDTTLVEAEAKTHMKTFIVNGLGWLATGFTFTLAAIANVDNALWFSALLGVFAITTTYLFILQPILLGRHYRQELLDEVRHTINCCVGARTQTD